MQNHPADVRMGCAAIAWRVPLIHSSYALQGTHLPDGLSLITAGRCDTPAEMLVQLVRVVSNMWLARQPVCAISAAAAHGCKGCQLPTASWGATLPLLLPQLLDIVEVHVGKLQPHLPPWVDEVGEIRLALLEPAGKVAAIASAALPCTPRPALRHHTLRGECKCLATKTAVVDRLIVCSAILQHSASVQAQQRKRSADSLHISLSPSTSPSPSLPPSLPQVHVHYFAPH